MNIGNSDISNGWQQFLDEADAARKRNSTFTPISVDNKIASVEKKGDIIPKDDISLEASRLGGKIYRTENRPKENDQDLGRYFDAYA